MLDRTRTIHQTVGLEMLVCGGAIGESQANMQVRNDIVAGWAELLGRDAVQETSIAAAASAIRASSPRFVLCVGSYLPETSYFGELRAAAAAVHAHCAFWATEDPYEIDACYRIANDFDAIFTCDSGAVDFYNRPNVHHLPMAGSRDHHYRVFDPDADRPIDVLFCGVAFNSRKHIVRGVLDLLRSVNTAVIGPGWGEFGRGFTDRRIEKAELIGLYASSKIVLNLGRSLSFENHRFKLLPATPGPRTFEAALAGGAQLFHEDTGELAKYFAAGDIAVFSSIHDLRRFLPELLDDQSERHRLARNAQAKALASHTYMHRAATMFEILQRLP